MDVVQGAIVVCSNFGGVDVVPLAEWMWCHCRVQLQCALVGGEGDDQLWRSGRGAIAVPL